MPDEIGVIICPNPKCHRKIEEPILLNNLSTKPAEKYYACPHCFVKLDADAESDEVKEESASGPALNPLLEKVMDIISAQPQGEKEEETRKEEPSIKSPEKEGKGPAECPNHFGYLANRPKNAPIPQECLICPKIVECMLKLSASESAES